MSYHYLGCHEKCYAMDTIPAFYDIRTTTYDRFSIVLRSFQGVEPWKLQSKLTFEPLVRFQSVLPLFWVPQNMQHNEHPPNPLRYTYDNLRSFFDCFTVISRCKALETSIKPNFWTVGRISKCLTIIWGRTRNATQWAQFQPSTTYGRRFSIILRSVYDLRLLKLQSQGMA